MTIKLKYQIILSAFSFILIMGSLLYVVGLLYWAYFNKYIYLLLAAYIFVTTLKSLFKVSKGFVENVITFGE